MSTWSGRIHWGGLLPGSGLTVTVGGGEIHWGGLLPGSGLTVTVEVWGGWGGFISVAC